MKNIKLASLLVLFISALTFTSCDNEPIDSAIDLGDFDNGGSSGGAAVFKADFSGSTWTAVGSVAVITGNVIQIVGSKADGSAFALQIQATTTGTYTANSNLLVYNPAQSQYAYSSINFQNPSENTGSVTITNIDTANKKISGTFNFKGYWTNTAETGVVPIDFTNGTFTNISYTTSGVVLPSTDLFSATVDGTEFIEDTIDVAEVISPGYPDSYSIVASKPNGDDVGLRISKALTVGTYAFTGPLAQDLTSSCLIDNLLYTADTGSLTITSKTATRIKGTFNMSVTNFTTSQTKVITQGSFDVELP